MLKMKRWFPLVLLVGIAAAGILAWIGFQTYQLVQLRVAVRANNHGKVLDLSREFDLHELDEESLRGWCVAASHLGVERSRERALQRVRSALEMSPQRQDLIVCYVGLAYTFQRPSEVTAEARQLLRRDEGNVMARLVLARAALAEREYDQAIRWARKAIERGDESGYWSPRGIVAWATLHSEGVAASQDEFEAYFDSPVLPSWKRDLDRFLLAWVSRRDGVLPYELLDSAEKEMKARGLDRTLVPAIRRWVEYRMAEEGGSPEPSGVSRFLEPLGFQDFPERGEMLESRWEE